MRVPRLVVLLVIASLWIGAGCASRSTRLPEARSHRDLVVYVFNDSRTHSVPVTINVDGVCVETRTYAPQERGELRLRRPHGVHRVRAVVASLTGQTEIDLDHFMCQVIYYDETTDPKDRGGVVPPHLTVGQIGWC